MKLKREVNDTEEITKPAVHTHSTQLDFYFSYVFIIKKQATRKA